MSHIPVLLKEVISGLELEKGMTVLDATLGGGGHSREICKIIGKDGILIGLDRDEAAVARVGKIIEDECNSHLFVSNFKDLADVLSGLGICSINAALFDLGLSSFQIDDSGRGFTFKKDEPLLMTFEKERGPDELTAEEVVNEWDENNIADIVYAYGGERFARRIAKSIVLARKEKRIKTTFDLVSAIEKAVPALYKRRKIHFATKTFQAIRMVVNDEVGSLRMGLNGVWDKICVGGRIAVISFHEIEDRIVKKFFIEKKQSHVGEILTKKPIVPGDEEVSENPRSRSAKLRIIKKING